MENQDILTTVIDIVRETLGLPDEKILSSTILLFYDLGFTSLDMLDFLYRIEEQFDIEIPEGSIYSLVKGELDKDRFENEGVLTNDGREHLLKALYDSPGEIFPEKIHINTLPRYCTIGAIVRLTEHKLREREVCSN